jgi:hypothetical protein
MGLRGTPIGNGAVMVRERPDSMRPGTVIAESGLPGANPTAAMGAGPASQQQMQPSPVPQQPQQIRPLTVPQPPAR